MAIESGARKMNISGREMHDHRHLSDPKYGLQLMSDPYILEDILVELGKS